MKVEKIMRLNLSAKKRHQSLVFISSLFLFTIYIFAFLMSFDLKTGPYGHDFSSFLLMAVNPMKEMGVPYRDYWDIKPPGLIALLQGWVFLFGYKGISFVIFPIFIYCIYTISLLIITWNLKRKIFPYILLALAQIPILRSLDGEMYLSSEFIGLPFSLLGLAFLVLSIRNNSEYGIIFAGLSGVLLTFSGLIKDPFFPATGVIIIFLSKREYYLKFLTSIFSSVLIILLFIYILACIDAWSSYLDVINFKKNAFGIEISIYFIFIVLIKSINIFIQLTTGRQLIFVLNILLFFIIFLFSSKKEDVSFVAVILWIMGNIAGYIMQNKSGGHYDVQLLASSSLGICILSLLLSEGICLFININYQKLPYKKTMDLLLMLSLSFFLFLNLNAVEKTRKRMQLSRIIESFRTITVKKDHYEKWNGMAAIINRFLNSSDSILVVYGWDVSSYYLYLNRQPATRYFIVNPLIMKEKQYAEFREKILFSPPSAIIYKTRDADMNIEEFEKNVLDIKNILTKKYTNSAIYSKLFIRNDLYEKGEK